MSFTVANNAKAENSLLALLHYPVLPHDLTASVTAFFQNFRMQEAADNQLLQDLRQELLDLPDDVPLREALESLNRYED